MKLPVIDLDRTVLGKENAYWRKWIEHPIVGTDPAEEHLEVIRGRRGEVDHLLVQDPGIAASPLVRPIRPAQALRVKVAPEVIVIHHLVNLPLLGEAGVRQLKTHRTSR